MKNPFLKKEIDLSRKISEWCRRTKTGASPYLEEALKLGAEKVNWDRMRMTAVKEAHNDSISDIVIEGSPDLILRLCPRVKLNYNCISGCFVAPSQLAYIIQNLLFKGKPIYIDLDDVKSDSPDKISIFFRDLSFVPSLDHSLSLPDKLSAALDFLIKQKKVTHISFGYNLSDLVYEAVIPPEDARLLLYRFTQDHPGYMKSRRPTILVHGLVSKCPSSSSKSTKDVLYSFFSFFGNIRFFDIQLDTASIEYQVHEEFEHALKTLCCCSLRQEDSYELFDYEVALSCPEEKED